MKKLSLILISILLVFGLCACGQSEEQRDCLDSLESGLENRWDLPQENSPDAYAGFAQAELDAISKYKDFSFEDKEFGKIINTYIGAVESQAEGAQYMLTDPKQFETMYYTNGYEVRAECLNKLCDKYSFKIDNKYEDDLQALLDGDYCRVLFAGETIDAKSEYGDLKVSVDSAKMTNWNTMDTSIEEGYNIVLVNCSVENVSYSDPYNGDYVSAEAFMDTTDDSGNSISPYSEAYDGAGYKPQAGGFWELSKGKKSKAAIPYLVPSGTTSVHVNVMGTDDKLYQVDLNVQ